MTNPLASLLYYSWAVTQYNLLTHKCLCPDLLPWDLNMALRIRTNEEWTTFFTSAGIPATAVVTYAEAFVTNRITEISLPGLDKATLTDLGITIGTLRSAPHLRRRRLKKSNQKNAPTFI